MTRTGHTKTAATWNMLGGSNQQCNLWNERGDSLNIINNLHACDNYFDSNQINKMIEAMIDSGCLAYCLMIDYPKQREEINHNLILVILPNS